MKEPDRKPSSVLIARYHKRSAWGVLMFLAAALPLSAQQIDLSLHPTAVPDSFEVRATSTGAPFDGLPNGTFTIRWESVAGGVLTNSDLAVACGGYSFGNSVGTLDVLDHRYFTINFFGVRPLSEAGCPITSAGMSLGGLRIRELSGCRNVELVSNAFVDLNNFAYYISMGGVDVTGDITSGPLPSGDCPPCIPVTITGTEAAPVPYCAFGVDLSVTASGSGALDYSWYRPDGSPLAWLPQISSPYEPAGVYTVVVSNACGSDTAQVEALFDQGLCVPPVFDSVWYTPWAGWAGIDPGIQLQTTVSGGCSEVVWTMPWGDMVSENPQHVVNVSNPTDGTYLAVVSNLCGSDTVEIMVLAPEPCSGPSVSNTTIISTSDSCSTGTAQFSATVTGPGPVTTGWYSPTGALLTGALQFTLPFAPWGTYTFIATNYCTSDTVAIFHGPSDTTGLAACQPPQILSLTTELLSCLNDTVQLIATTLLTGPCASLVWSNVEVLSISGDTTIAVLVYADPIILTVTNGCGQASAVAPLTVEYPHEDQRYLCGNPGVLSLDSIMHLSFSYEGGEWSYAGQPHAPFYDPALDTTGLYVYTSMLSCPVVHFYLTEYQGAYAGEDSAIAICAADPPFPMFDLIGGVPEADGAWLFSGSVTDQIFDPALDPAGVYAYRVTVWESLGVACADEALLTVVVTPTVAWYSDLDDDGLGDPAHGIQACEQPPGTVDNADDGCPALFGTAGDACDDGDPETVLDMITAECECAGDPDNGINDNATGTIALWPNPNRGGAFFLRLPMSSGQVELTITDATGRIVLCSATTTSFAPLQVSLPANVASGWYTLRIVSGLGAETLRFVVGR